MYKTYRLYLFVEQVSLTFLENNSLLIYASRNAVFFQASQYSATSSIKAKKQKKCRV